MAAVPENTGFANVAPDATPPADSFNIRADPSQFGGLVARGEQALGAGASKAGEFFGQIQTDDMLNGAMDATNKALDSFRKLRGQDALNAQEGTTAAIDKAFKDARDNLSTPAQQYQFDQTARTYRERYVAGIIASHAAQASLEYGTHVNNASAQIALTGITGSPDDEETVTHNIEDLKRAKVRQVMLEGNGSDPEIVKAAVNQASQIGYKAQAEALSVKDPKAALDLVEKRKDVLGPYYEPLSQQFRTRVNQQIGIGAAQQAIREAGGDMQGQPPASAAPKPVLQDVKGAIIGQESENSDNAPPSVAGAIGPGQIKPDTFKLYARPGESIDNPEDNRRVSARIVDDLAQRFNNDPERIAVGYFSGPGNVAPIGSPTPWKQDFADGNGKTVSSYVSDVQKRLASVSPGLALRAGAVDRIMAATAGNPEAQRYALAYMREQFDAAQIGALADAKAKKDAAEKAGNGYVSEMMKATASGQPLGPDLIKRIAADPSLDEGMKAHLWSMAETHMRSDVDHDTKTYGNRFYDIYRQIHLPDDDPQRLTDPRQLYQLVGPNNDLTVAGVDRLSQEIAGKRTAGGEARATMIHQYLANAKTQISGADEGLHIKDPKGEQLYLRFLADFFPRLEAGEAAGKSAAQLLSPDSPDYLGKSISGFKRPMSQWMSDMMSDNAGPAGDLVFNSATELVAAVRAGKVSRAQAEEMAVQRGWMQDPRAGAAGAHPPGP